MHSGCSSPAVICPVARPETRVVRLRGAVIAAACWAVLVAAATLQPDPSGYGTHEQWNLPPCSFVISTGLPCPTCGLTTAMSAMVRGDVAAAAKAQPFGVALFAVVVTLAAFGSIEAVSGRDVLRYLRPGLWWAWASLLGLLAGWGVKLATGYADGTLPIR